MKREIIKTGDGSTTIHLPEWNEQYHSKHGAIQEAQHVFIQMGLLELLKSAPEEIQILEIGFGTGLNALVTWRAIKALNIPVSYCGVEAYPVSMQEVEVLNFSEEISEDGAEDFFTALHQVLWEIPQKVSDSFILIKQKKFFSEIEDVDGFNLIYFDAFGARVQPELWTEEIFSKMFRALRHGGILVTYAAKGSVRRAMQQVGFKVEKLPGPPGKREMLRAKKL